VQGRPTPISRLTGAAPLLENPVEEETMANTFHNVGVASQIGSYSDAVEAPANARWLFTSGTPGLARDGALADDIAGQAEMTVADLVKVTHYLTRASDIAVYVKVRAHFLGDARPASMLLVVPELVRPQFLLEVEAISAKA